MNRIFSLLHILVDCVWTSICNAQQSGKLDDMPHSVEMKVNLCIVVLEDYGNNLAQAKDNNANEIYGMASMLWDIIASWESKHSWKMAKETWVDVLGLVSTMTCFSWTRRVW